MIMKSDAKFKEKLTCVSNMNLVKFYQTTQKSDNFFSMDFFCTKYTRFELEK